MERKPEKLTTIDDAMDRLGITRLAADGKVKNPSRLVRAMGRRGEIDIRKVGRFVMVTERSIDNLVAGKA